jgi:peptidoglycan/LPS O-acetylase OafA/YrhL
MNIGRALSLNVGFDNKRVYGLDILRCFAILTVVVTHSMAYCTDSIKNIVERIYLDGVTIFFVLSGFLIGRILIKTMSYQNLKINTLISFWWRRWLRTLPVYYAALSFFIIAYNYHKPPGPTFKRFYFFSQNIFTPHPTFFIEAWSLSVEEWFYLLIPVLLFILIRYVKVKIPTSFLIVSALVIIFSTAVRLERYYTDATANELQFAVLIRMQVVTRLDSLMYGVLGAFASFFYYKNWIKHSRFKFIAGILILVINKIISLYYTNNEGLVFYHTVFYFSFNSIGALLTLPYLSNYKTGKGTVYKSVTYISIISYSMYLINLTPLQDYIMPFVNKHFVEHFTSGNIRTIDFFLFYILTIILSGYSYKFIERPFLKFRDRFNLSNLSARPAV